VSAGDYLIWRRSGIAWALPEDAVTLVDGNRGRATITSAGRELRADEIIGFARQLAVRRPGPLVDRLLPQRCVGLAVHAGTPVVVVDPASPPIALRNQGAREHAD